MKHSNLSNANGQGFFGIDISSQSLDLADFTFSFTETFANDPDGIARLVQHLHDRPAVRIVVEATGGYEVSLIVALCGLSCRSRQSIRVRSAITPVHWAFSQKQTASTLRSWLVSLTTSSLLCAIFPMKTGENSML